MLRTLLNFSAFCFNKNVVYVLLQTKMSVSSGSDGNEQMDLWDRSFSDAPEPDEVEQPTNLPVHITRLLNYVMGDNFDVNDTATVETYISNQQQSVAINEVVRLLKLMASMRLSSVFDDDDIKYVKEEIQRIVRAEDFEHILKLARREHRKQLLGQLIDGGLLKSNTTLFQKLIRNT